jgi:hypothetical protein
MPLNPMALHGLLQGLLSFFKVDVVAAVVVKSSIFWDITLHSPSKDSRHFREICHLHLRIGEEVKKEPS